MLDQDFCEYLEYEICKALEHSDNDQIKGFWCDGILLSQPDSVSSPFIVQLRSRPFYYLKRKQ